jgi:hypothetical protein
MGLTRIPLNRAETLSHTWYVDETATDPTGTPTCTVTDANGDTVDSDDAAIVGSGTGRTTFALAAQSVLKRGRIAWTATVAGGSVTEYDYFEIVGGFFFGLAEGRASDSSLSNTTTYPTADLKTKRVEVEQECETICDRSFVPRYDRVTLDGSGTSTLILRMSDPNRSVADVRTIRSIKVAPAVDETFVTFSVAELAATTLTSDGQLYRTDGAIFTAGVDNVIVEFEYGLDLPPGDLVQASLARFRSRLNLNKSGIPDRASSYTAPEGGTYRIAMPGPFLTGLPEVDAVYGRYSRRSTGTGSSARTVPASRSLTYNPQAYSMFHGRRSR